MKSRSIHIILFVLLLQSAACAVWSKESGPASNSDSSASPYEENLKRWRNMSEEERQAIRQRYHSMDAGERQAVIENSDKFKRLPPEDRDRIRNNFHRFRELPQERRELMRENYRRFENRPPSEREEMRRGARTDRGRGEVIRDRPPAGRDRGYRAAVQGGEHDKQRGRQRPGAGPERMQTDRRADHERHSGHRMNRTKGDGDRRGGGKRKK